MSKKALGLGVIGVSIALIIWELVPRFGLVPIEAIPPASAVLLRLGELAVTSQLWLDSFSTLRGWLLGLLIAAGIAVPVGLLLGSFPLLYRAFRVPLEFLRPIPSVALLPLLVLILGITFEMKVALVTFGALWPLLVMTVYGVQEVDPVARDTARSLGYSQPQMFVRVVFPSALPNIATGLRTSAAIALVLAITAELVAGVSGLGRSILVAQSSGNSTTMYALIVMTGLLGVTLFYIFVSFERVLLRWHPSHREGQQ